MQYEFKFYLSIREIYLFIKNKNIIHMLNGLIPVFLSIFSIVCGLINVEYS